MQMRFQPWQGIAPLLIASLLVLAGCSSVPQSDQSVADASSRRQSASASSGKRLPALPRAGSGRGGYYQDDGPGESPPEGLHDLPDAEPKIEPYSLRGNKPYVVFGKAYTPITDDRPLKQRGRGSWYGKKFHGQKTSSGEPYDMYKMTAAHPTLPIPSYARVTNIANGNQVIVRVNDRGPFHSSRVIDLSYTAALKLGYIAKGSTELEVERLLPEEILRIANNKQYRPDNPSLPVAPQTSMPGPVPVIEAVQRREGNQFMAGAAIEAKATDIQSALPAASQPDLASGTATVAMPVISGNATSGFFLQLGAYAQASNAEAARNRLAQNWIGTLPPLEIVQYAILYRLYSGPFATRSAADSAAQQVEVAGAAKPLIVQR